MLQLSTPRDLESNGQQVLTSALGAMEKGKAALSGGAMT